MLTLPASATSLLDHMPAGTKPLVKGFTPFFADCKSHGQYQENHLDSNGIERWLPQCPQCRKARQANALLSVADIPARFANCTFDTYRAESEGQKRALGQCKSYADNFAEYVESGTCLILRGSPGTGKNHLITAIARELMPKRYSVLRLKAQEFIEAYWAKDFSERAKWMRGIAEIDLLILDELGRASQTKGSEDAFFRLLDARYESVKPTAILSNLAKDQFKSVLGEAAYDRLKGGKMINFDWESYRGGAA